ncbi:hypothetical protein SOVF_031450 [Spinacia oleracea]|nr:hypothetical protein SOVF_031450 [Spinacia oleracea]
MDIFINFTTNCLTIGLTSTYSSRGWTWAKTMICVLSGTGTRHTLVSDNQEAAGQVASAVVTLPQRRPELGGRRSISIPLVFSFGLGGAAWFVVRGEWLSTAGGWLLHYLGLLSLLFCADWFDQFGVC